jgi:hypothetical protein
MRDTFSTDHFGLALAAMIVEDWETRNQLFAWRFFSDRIINSFEFFLLVVREKPSNGIRVMIADRSQTQIIAISKVFSNALIVLCPVYIMHNVD